ncbi:MAG TPA: hypothetical protein VGY52_17580 [Roseiarcus sp.]|nr:hypothetical protein [Roseiarcus sp.]
MNAYSILFSPLLPWPALEALGLVAFLLVALALVRRRRGALLRGLAFAALLAALADPSLTREDRRPLKDVVAVVVDRSDSQTIGARMAQTDAALAETQKRLAALGNVETRVIEAGKADSENQGTRLFSALQAGLADVPPERVGAAILITDGVVHDIPPSAGALGFKAPVHALVTGHEGERDRRIELVEAPRFGIVGKEQTIIARVLDTADAGEPVSLDVRRDGAKVATLKAAVGDTIRVPVAIDHAGPNVVELEVAPIANELTTLNNKAVVTIDGVRDKLRVLLVSGEPHQGERMWRNLLKSDANVDLVHFTILRPPEKSVDGTPINELSLIAFPVADLFGRKIKDFDLIILDRYSSQSILPKIYFDNIVSYVRQGGAVLMAEGPDYSTPEGLYFSPLGEIAPAKPDGDVIDREFRATISPEGARHPVTRGLTGSESSPPAWGPWFRQIGAEPTSGVNILNGADNRPLLVLSRVDKGRIALLLSDQLWLWARGFEGGGPHLDLLRRLAHWLMKEPELEEEALRANAHGRALTIERQSLKGDVPEATVTGPTGETFKAQLKPAEPGLSRATIEVDKFGLYRVGDGERQALVNVGPANPIEFQEVVSTLEKLRPLAEATGGTVRRLATDAGGDIAMPSIVAMHAGVSYGGAGYIGVKRTESSVIVGVASMPLAIGFLGLAALLGALVLAWWREGSSGGREKEA